ncbi:hypothetical protein D7X30_06435 [Corallococcus sp. AB011P]|nr:hypothetical protein D7X30_06435 [Corallococcus sp. AB011P]
MTAKVFDEYGVWEPDVEAALRTLGPVLGIPFNAHYSDYLGGDYYRASYQGGEVAIRPNYLYFTKSWAAEEHREFSTLLFVSGIADPDGLRQLLQERCGSRVVWLKRVSVEKNRKSEVIFKLNGHSA